MHGRQARQTGQLVPRCRSLGFPTKQVGNSRRVGELTADRRRPPQSFEDLRCLDEASFLK